MGIIQCLLGIWKKSPHLIFGFAVELAAFITHPVLVRDLLACLDTEQNIMGNCVLRKCIMNIVCRN